LPPIRAWYRVQPAGIRCSSALASRAEDGASSTSEAPTVAKRKVTTVAGNELNFPEDSPVAVARAHFAGVIFTPARERFVAVTPGSDP
jgi:hypothetical protein